MRCRWARTTLLERELETLPPGRIVALERHLAACRDCAAEARRGRSVHDQLLLLRGEMPFEIDVTHRVMARVRQLGPPRPDEMPLRQWVLSAVAAVVCGVMIVGALWDILPGLAEPGRSAIGLIAGFREVMGSLTAPVAGLLAIPFKLLGTLISSLAALAPLLSRLVPLATVFATLAVASMSATVVYFVGRDLKNRPIEPLRDA